MNPQRVYSGTTEGLFVSSNDGQNWTRLTANNVTVNAIQVNPQNNQRILIGTEYDGILLSENGGKTWRASNAGFIHKEISWIVPDPDNTGCFLAGLASGSGGFYFYDSRTGAWTHSQIEEGTLILSFLILPQNRGELAGTLQGAFWHANNSKPWVKLKGSIAKRAVYSLAVDLQNSVVYAGTDQGIYRTSQSAMDFRLPPNYRLSPQVWCINASSAGVVFAGSSLGLLRSWDRGTIWNAISSYGLPGRTPIGSIAVSPLDKEHLFAGTSVGLYESTNGGVYWRQVGGGRMGMKIPSVVFLDNSGKRILAANGNSGGVFYSKDGGQNWDQISAEFESPATCIALDPGQPSRVLLGTQSDGIYLLDLP